MRKLNLVFLLVVLLGTVSSVSAQTDSSTRVFEPLDRGLNYRFTYPLTTHSVRIGNLAQPQTGDPVIFGGLIAVEPNDSYIYDSPNPSARRFTEMRVLAIPTSPAPRSLSALVGTLPLFHLSDPFDGTIVNTTLGGQPAVRAVTSDGFTTEIIAYYDGVIYEIVLDGLITYMGFTLPEGVTYDPVYDDILKSWEFTQLVK